MLLKDTRNTENIGIYMISIAFKLLFVYLTVKPKLSDFRKKRAKIKEQCLNFRSFGKKSQGTKGSQMGLKSLNNV